MAKIVYSTHEEKLSEYELKQVKDALNSNYPSVDLVRTREVIQEKKTAKGKVVKSTKHLRKRVKLNLANYIKLESDEEEYKPNE